MKITILGSYKRDLPGLKKIHEVLTRDGWEILSPRSLNFIYEEDGFLFSDTDISRSPHITELQHLNAIREADIVWLHTSLDGYVGTSAAIEIGWARAIGKEVLCNTPPNDVMLASFCNSGCSIDNLYLNLSDKI